MNKDWTFGKTIEITKDQKQILAQCRTCQKLFELPNPPACDTCQLPLDLCTHGLACESCSYRLILERIKEGSLKKGALPEEYLTRIKEALRVKFKQEVYEEGEYLRVKEVHD